MRKYMRLVGLAGFLLLTVLIAPAGASPTVKHPTGDYAVFNNCPTEVPGVELCMTGTDTGEIQLGKVSMPITQPTEIQAGLHENSATGQLEVIPAANGESFAMPPEEVPGGIFALADSKYGPFGFLRYICKTFPQDELCKLTGTAELVGLPKINTAAVIFEEGVGLEVPLRVHLNNPLLGNRCYIGSPSTPIVMRFTTGTTSPPPPNVPIKGSAGSLEIKDEGSFLSLSNDILVDNTFAAPEAEGCGGFASPIVDRVIDRAVGLPSPAGKNTAKLQGTLYLAVASAVTASE
jgi:hypothetical protein